MKVMNAAAVVVEGTVQPDGTLEVTQKVNLPAGRVHVTVEPIAGAVQPDRLRTMMESIWAAQLASGRTPRTQAEIDSEIEAMRNESEEELQAVERLQEECRTAREQATRTLRDDLQMLKKLGLIDSGGRSVTARWWLKPSASET